MISLEKPNLPPRRKERKDFPWRSLRLGGESDLFSGESTVICHASLV
jgi:hypothetical protein